MRALKPILTVAVAAAAAHIALRFVVFREKQQSAAATQAALPVPSRVSSGAQRHGAVAAASVPDTIEAAFRGRGSPVATPLPAEIPLCRPFDLAGVPDDVLARTQFRTREGLGQFIESNEKGFYALRRAINPVIVRSGYEAKKCFEEDAPDASVEVEFEWTVKSTPRLAQARDMTVRRMNGSPEALNIAKNCLAASLLRDGFTIEERARSEPFVSYEGLYPHVFRLSFRGAKHAARTN